MGENLYFPYLTWCEINLDSIIHNLKWVKNKVGERVKICFAGTKADGYGYGMLEVAEAAIEAGVDYLGVSIPQEGIYLRKKGIKIPIIVFGTIIPEMAGLVVNYDLTQTVSTYQLCESLVLAGKAKGKIVKVHIKVDTGMGRIGIYPEETLSFLKKVSKFENLFIEGIYTHLSSVGRDDDYTRMQIDKFLNVIKEIEEYGFKIPIKHIANSGAIKMYPETYLDMVRPGSIIFNGGLPELREVFSLKSRVVYVKEVKPGDRIGYRGTYCVKKKTKIATVAAGYVDGYSFLLGKEKWNVIIRDKYFPVVGRVCMDQIMVDVGKENIEIGDEVVIIGKTPNCEIKLNSIFAKVDFFNFLAPSIGKRVPRIYIKNSKIYKIRTIFGEEINETAGC